jgi:hypothetical protein
MPGSVQRLMKVGVNRRRPIVVAVGAGVVLMLAALARVTSTCSTGRT